jgi:hypothetical protein
MFFEEDKIRIFREMIVATDKEARQKAPGQAAAPAAEGLRGHFRSHERLSGYYPAS